jgi:hypothetical protein
VPDATVPLLLTAADAQRVVVVLGSGVAALVSPAADGVFACPSTWGDCSRPGAEWNTGPITHDLATRRSVLEISALVVLKLERNAKCGQL